MSRVVFAVGCVVWMSAPEPRALAQDAPTIVGVPLADVPSTLDSRFLPDLRLPDPDNIGNFVRVDGVLVMPIYDSEPEAILHYPCRRGRFYIALREPGNQERYYGPIEGDPFVRLNLEEAMRTRLRSAYTYPNDALRRLCQLIACGDDKLRTLGFSMVKELPVPKQRHLLRSLEETLDEAVPEVRDATVRGLGEEARERVAELTATAVADWNARRVLLPDEEYQAGNDGDAPAEIVWGEADEESGLQVGFGLATANGDDPVGLNPLPWKFGESMVLTVWVRQLGHQTTKFTSSSRTDEGLTVWFVDEQGEQHQQPLVFFTGWLVPERYRLSPGQWRQLKSLELRPYADQPADQKQRSRGLVVEPGEYALLVELRIAGFESGDGAGAVTVPAQGEWTGMLTVAGGDLHIGE